MIRLLRNAIEWCFRRMATLLVATLLIWAALHLHRIIKASLDLPKLETSYEEASRSKAAYTSAFLAGLDEWKEKPAAVINDRIAAIDEEHTALKAERPLIPLSADDLRRSMQIRLLELERAHLVTLRDRTMRLDDLLARHQQAYAALKTEFAPGAPIACHSTARLTDVTARRKRLVELCRANEDAAATYQAAKRLRTTLKSPNIATELDEILQPLRSKVEQTRNRAQGWLGTRIAELRNAFVLALKGLIGLLLLPPLIRTLFYFLVAPAAARRAPIRLLPDSSGEIDVAASTSAVSSGLRVSPEEELLVHPEYLQSRAQHARVNTKWLLANGYPLTSLASGLIALTRIRTSETESFVISATGADPLTEIAAIPIPAGSAVVLQPRALVGVRQRRSEPMRITSHWRLASLSAWLTLQLRYLVFHGPATLIVRGCRGVRIERADEGRRISQSATIGFGANVLYSVARAEPFFPYLTGRRALFDDRFTGGTGYYIYEETTGIGGSSNPLGRQFNTLSDAILKIFGV
jgi:hypothetical protein